MCTIRAYLNVKKKEGKNVILVLLGKKKYITIFMFVYFLLGFFPPEWYL